jgi:hypothetical protein
MDVNIDLFLTINTSLSRNLAYNFMSIYWCYQKQTKGLNEGCRRRWLTKD